MAAAAETRVFLEVRRRLQSALLILGEPKESGLLMDISITPSSLQMKTPEGCTEIRLPTEVRLVPSSCRGLQYVAGDGLHLRLQAQAEFNTKLISMFNQSSQAQDCCTFYCQSCGEVIIRDSPYEKSPDVSGRVLPVPAAESEVSAQQFMRALNLRNRHVQPTACGPHAAQDGFECGRTCDICGGGYHENYARTFYLAHQLSKLLRVLPLPSENWGALVGEWCCHPDPFANKPLHPQENDCFFGDSFFLVNLRSDLWQPRPELAPVKMHCLFSEKHFKLKPKANTKVICKRCKVTLGETMSSETIKFYMTEIMIQPSERNFPIIPRSQFVQSIIAQCLVELSSARSTFRFSIQGHDGKAYILLWLLNSDSLVIESSRHSKSIKKFPLLEDIWKADSSSAWNAVKVLYQPCITGRNEKLASSWESDISVHSLTLPSATCLELLLILSRNNATLPLSLRYMNSFQVAFLKM